MYRECHNITSSVFTQVLLKRFFPPKSNSLQCHCKRFQLCGVPSVSRSLHYTVLLPSWKIMLYFLFGLTAEMVMMTVMDDTVKMNRDFYRKYRKKSPISFDVSVRSSICRQACTNHDLREITSKL